MWCSVFWCWVVFDVGSIRSLVFRRWVVFNVQSFDVQSFDALSFEVESLNRYYRSAKKLDIASRWELWHARQNRQTSRNVPEQIEVAHTENCRHRQNRQDGNGSGICSKLKCWNRQKTGRNADIICRQKVENQSRQEEMYRKLKQTCSR